MAQADSPARAWLPELPVAPGTDAVVLCHDSLRTPRAKTTHGLLRHGLLLRICAVVDRGCAGADARQVCGIPASSSSCSPPHVPVLAEVPESTNVLVIGVAPPGGAAPLAWREEIAAVLARGGLVISGMHEPLLSDPELAKAAVSGGGGVWEVRAAPPTLPLAHLPRPWPVPVVLTVGTDAACGKRTAAVALVEAAEEQRIDARFVPSGQTGILLGRGRGVAADHLVADFLSGVFQRLVEDAIDEGAQLVVVEGQGALSHPAYGAVSYGLLQGVAPTHLLMVHPHGRQERQSFAPQPVPTPMEECTRIRQLSHARLLGLALNPGGAGRTLQAALPLPPWDAARDGPVVDVLRQGATALLANLAPSP